MNSQIISFETPERFKGRTGLQIFVDRFYRDGPPPEPMEGRVLKDWNDVIPDWEPDSEGEYQNNYFYGGNLKGITAKLDYIKTNGFNIIYLSPIGLSETSHHYEPIDQFQIDPWIGKWKDYRELCHAAHRKDILIVVDLVFNHMSVNSPYFQEALKNPYSKYHDWFEWDNDGKPVFWGNFKNMPQTNKKNPEFQEYACSITRHYINLGADGVRYDLGENFPAEFMKKQRDTVKAINPEVLMVSEMWGLDTQRNYPQLDGKQVDSVMNYPLSDSICRWVRYGNVPHFMYNFKELQKYPKEAQNVLFNFLDSHDTPRAIDLLVAEGMLEDPYKGQLWDIEEPWRYNGGFDTYGFRKWEVEHDYIDLNKARNSLIAASTIQYFMPGIPIVYAGTEIGMTGYKDPFNRKPYDWENPDVKILEHYRTIGAIRKKNREFFSCVGEIQIDLYGKTMKIVRKNQYGEKILEIIRNPADLENGWRTSIFSKEY